MISIWKHYQEKRPYRSGRASATDLVKASLTLLVEIWYARNDQFHNHDDEDGKPSPKIKAIHQRVRMTYTDKLAYSRATRAKLFDITL